MPQRGSHTALKSALKFLVICIPHMAWMSNKTKQIQETKVIWSCLSLLHFSGFHANPFPSMIPTKMPELKSASSRGHYSSQNISRGINNFDSHKVKTVQLEQDNPVTRILANQETQDELLHCMFPVERLEISHSLFVNNLILVLLD